jgi:hypothetical protein
VKPQYPGIARVLICHCRPNNFLPTKESIMLRAIVISAAVCTLSVSAFAQGNLVGKWGGSFKLQNARGGASVGMDLEITGVENNVREGCCEELWKELRR